MGSEYNHVDTAKILEKAREEIKSGESKAKRHPKILKNVDLNDSTMLDKRGVPVKETVDKNSGKDVTE